MAHAVPTVMRSRSDVVVAVSPSLSGLAAAHFGRRGRPLGVIVQDFTGDGASQTGTAGTHAASAITRIEQRLLRRANQVGVISTDFVRQAIDAGVHPDRISLVPNFTHIDPADVSMEEARSVLGWNQEAFTVVHTGNMGLKQGLHHVVDAARHAEQRGERIDWVLLGDGNQRKVLEAQARGVASIRFVDPLPEADYPYALAAADVLLLSENSGVKEFCLPSKLTSYVVSGRPILAATDRGSITHRTIERYGFAHLVDAGDSLQLLAGLDRIRANPTLVKSLVESAAAYSSLTSRHDASARYVDFIDGLVHRT